MVDVPVGRRLVAHRVDVERGTNRRGQGTGRTFRGGDERGVLDRLADDGFDDPLRHPVLTEHLIGRHPPHDLGVGRLLDEVGKPETPRLGERLEHLTAPDVTARGEELAETAALLLLALQRLGQLGAGDETTLDEQVAEVLVPLRVLAERSVAHRSLRR